MMLVVNSMFIKCEMLNLCIKFVECDFIDWVVKVRGKNCIDFVLEVVCVVVEEVLIE